MSAVLLLLLVVVVYVVVALHIDKKKTRTHVMWEGRLLKSEVVYREGEKLYVEKVAFKDWHVSIHNYYLISDRLTEGHTIQDQKWNYDDFCNITVQLENCTYALIRQVEFISLVRSYRPIPIEEFDRLARPLLS